MIAVLIISFSVAADATAVAIAAALRGVSLRYGMAMASAFGLAQAIMAAIGWLGGAAVGALWAAWDHWVALALLSAVGAKMIKEAFESEEEKEVATGPGLASLLVLAIATSIDSLAVGVSLPTLGTPPLVSVAMIGIVTFLCSAAGAAFGRILGQRFGRAMEVAGGLALIAIGIRIVFEHTA